MGPKTGSRGNFWCLANLVTFVEVSKGCSSKRTGTCGFGAFSCSDCTDLTPPAKSVFVRKKSMVLHVPWDALHVPGPLAGLTTDAAKPFWQRLVSTRSVGVT